MDGIENGTAVEFIKRIERAMNVMFMAIDSLRPYLNKDQDRALTNALGEAISELDIGVLEIIYRCHPDLRSEGGRP